MFSKQIKDKWLNCYNQLITNGVMSELFRGEVTLNSYKGYLRETYFHAGLNPQIQAYATMFLPREMRNIHRKFYQHAISEIGHDLLALNDLCVLGESEKDIINGRPLATTVALNAYPIFQIQFGSPLSYLGYLFHLEFLPTTSGARVMEQLTKMGISENALTFIKEHSEVDIHHNKLMEAYIAEMVKTQNDCDIVIAAAIDTCLLYSNFLRAAFDNGNQIFEKKVA